MTPHTSDVGTTVCLYSTGSNVSDTGLLDTNSSDNVILITQLREQIESLKKQLQGKDAQLLEKDKKVAGHSHSWCKGPQYR